MDDLSQSFENIQKHKESIKGIKIKAAEKIFRAFINIFLD